MKRADQVLAVRVVDAGLAADRRVHLGEERGRHLHERQAAEQRRRREACEVAHHTAAEGDDGRPALDPRVEEAVVEHGEPGEVLVLLAVGDHHDDRRKTRVAERRDGRLAVEGPDALARDERAAALEPRRGEARAELREQPRADQHGVRARAEVHPHLVRLLDRHGCSRGHPCLTVPPRAPAPARPPARR